MATVAAGMVLSAFFKRRKTPPVVTPNGATAAAAAAAAPTFAAVTTATADAALLNGRGGGGGGQLLKPPRQLPHDRGGLHPSTSTAALGGPASGASAGVASPRLRGWDWTAGRGGADRKSVV